MLPKGNAWVRARNERDRIMEDAMLTAYAVIAVLGYKEDDLSEREAFELYGRAWVKDRTRRGQLRFERHGEKELSPKVYSRFEIESLKRAEKNISISYQAALNEMERLKAKTEKKTTRKKSSD